MGTPMFLTSTLLMLTLASGEPLSGGPPVDTKLARSLIRELGSHYSADYSVFFAVISDASTEKSSRIKSLADSVHLQIVEFARKLDLKMTPPDRKATVVFFSKWQDYARHGREAGFAVDENAPGFFDHQSGVCFVFDYANSSLMLRKRAEISAALAELKANSENKQPNSLSPEDVRKRFDAVRRMQVQLDEHERLINQTVIRHELAHQVLSRLGIQTGRMKDRRWICEGLAMQFEILDPINGSRLADFRAIDWGDDRLSIHNLVSDSKLLGPGATNAPAGYAAAWGLVYYLINERPKQFAAYLERLRDSTPAVGSMSDGDEDFIRCIGEPDAKFQLAWLEYMSALK